MRWRDHGVKWTVVLKIDITWAFFVWVSLSFSGRAYIASLPRQFLCAHGYPSGRGTDFDASLAAICQYVWTLIWGVLILKWGIYKSPCNFGWFGGTTILGNLHLIYQKLLMAVVFIIFYNFFSWIVKVTKADTQFTYIHNFDGTMVISTGEMHNFVAGCCWKSSELVSGRSGLKISWRAGLSGTPRAASLLVFRGFSTWVNLQGYPTRGQTWLGNPRIDLGKL